MRQIYAQKSRGVSDIIDNVSQLLDQYFEPGKKSGDLSLLKKAYELIEASKEDLRELIEILDSLLVNHPCVKFDSDVSVHQPVKNLTKVAVPGDGSCLLHAFRHADSSLTSDKLRAQMALNSVDDSTLASFDRRDFSGNESAESDKWAQLTMVAAEQLSGKSVVVYHEDSGHYANVSGRRLSQDEVSSLNNKDHICVFYSASSCHYSAANILGEGYYSNFFDQMTLEIQTEIHRHSITAYIKEHEEAMANFARKKQEERVRLEQEKADVVAQEKAFQQTLIKLEKARLVQKKLEEDLKLEQEQAEQAFQDFLSQKSSKELNKAAAHFFDRPMDFSHNGDLRTNSAQLFQEMLNLSRPFLSANANKKLDQFSKGLNTEFESFDLEVSSVLVLHELNNLNSNEPFFHFQTGWSCKSQAGHAMRVFVEVLETGEYRISVYNTWGSHDVKSWKAPAGFFNTSSGQSFVKTMMRQSDEGVFSSTEMAKKLQEDIPSQYGLRPLNFSQNNKTTKQKYGTCSFAALMSLLENKVLVEEPEAVARIKLEAAKGFKKAFDSRVPEKISARKGFFSSLISNFKRWFKKTDDLPFENKFFSKYLRVSRQFCQQVSKGLNTAAAAA